MDGGDVTGARLHFERALAIDPNDAPTHARFGMLLDEAMGEHGAAARHYGLAARLFTERGNVELAAESTRREAEAERKAAGKGRGSEGS